MSFFAFITLNQESSKLNSIKGEKLNTLKPNTYFSGYSMVNINLLKDSNLVVLALFPREYRAAIGLDENMNKKEE